MTTHRLGLNDHFRPAGQNPPTCPAPLQKHPPVTSGQGCEARSYRPTLLRENPIRCHAVSRRRRQMCRRHARRSKYRRRCRPAERHHHGRRQSNRHRALQPRYRCRCLPTERHRPCHRGERPRRNLLRGCHPRRHRAACRRQNAPKSNRRLRPRVYCRHSTTQSALRFDSFRFD